MANTVQTIKNLDEVINNLTNYDELTGFPNRILFSNRLQQALLRSQDKNRLVAVILLNLNNFREIHNALARQATTNFTRLA